jgi:hypothetical protein
MKNQNRVSQKQIEELLYKISQRDKDILQSLQKCRYLTTNQIRKLHFTNSLNQIAAIRAANRGLKKLSNYGLIEALRRRVGGELQGSDPYIWLLSAAGVRLVAMLNPDEGQHKRYFAPSPYFLKHTLVTAEAYLQLLNICENSKVELKTAELEPECWRYFAGDKGKKYSYKPDMYAVTENGGYLDYWFIEIDLATESYPTVLEKCERCILYHKSGVEQTKNRVFPYVLWIVPSVKRKEKILEKLRERYGAVPKLFIVITPDELESLIVGGAEAIMKPPP